MLPQVSNFSRRWRAFAGLALACFGLASVLAAAHIHLPAELDHHVGHGDLASPEHHLQGDQEVEVESGCDLCQLIDGDLALPISRLPNRDIFLELKAPDVQAPAFEARRRGPSPRAPPISSLAS